MLLITKTCHHSVEIHQIGCKNGQTSPVEFDWIVWDCQSTWIVTIPTVH